jgi:hypothetical protein
MNIIIFMTKKLELTFLNFTEATVSIKSFVSIPVSVETPGQELRLLPFKSSHAHYVSMTTTNR